MHERVSNTDDSITLDSTQSN